MGEDKASKKARRDVVDEETGFVVRHYRVEADAIYCGGPGERAKLVAGSVISNITHDIGLAQQQGIKLRRCPAPDVLPPPDSGMLREQVPQPLSVDLGVPAGMLGDEDLVLGTGEGGES